MESFTVNICQKKEGSVWQNRTRVTGIGPLLCIENDRPDHLRSRCHRVRIVHAVVDATTHRILTGDRNGFVYIFDLEKNKFHLLCQLSCCSSALAFTPLEERDILIGTSDCKLHLFESASGEHIARLSGHETCISRITVDKEGNRALTCSLTSAILWDLLTLTAVQQLALLKDTNVVDAFFLGSGEAIITALNGNIIGLWDATDLESLMEYKFLENKTSTGIHTIDVSSDDKFLAAAGRSNWIVIWEVVNPRKPQEMTVSRNITSIRQVKFLSVSRLPQFPSDHVLMVLNHIGSLHLYVVETGENILNIVPNNDRILSVHSAGESTRFVACMCSGGVHAYDFEAMMVAKDTKHYLEIVSRGDDAMEELGSPTGDTAKDKTRLSELTIGRLKGIVKEFGSYPDKYRYMIWKNLLKLPGNESAFRVLAEKGVHRAYADVPSRYPIGNLTLLRALERVLSMLAHWCPKLSEVDFLPVLAFPFVKLFHNNLQLCLEVIITFLCNWCQNWFVYFPNIPFNVLAAVENVLAVHDASLLLHFVRHGVTAQVYAWPLLHTVFSEVISKDDWLQLFDHVLSNSPSYLLYVVVAFNMAHGRELKKLKTDFHSFYQQHHSVPSVRDIVSLAYRIQSSSDSALREIVSAAMGPFAAVPSGNLYQFFNSFPKLSINLKDERKELDEEMNYFKLRQELLLRDSCTEVKKPCTCRSKPLDGPHLYHVMSENDANYPAETCTRNRPMQRDNASRQLGSIASKQISEPSLKKISSVRLQSEDVISQNHTDVVKQVLNARRLVAREGTVKQRSVADDWNYEML